MNPTFFESSSDLRKWFEANHASGRELIAGLYKKSTGRPSVTYSEVLDQALCFGWIDGVRRSIDDTSWTIRLTPRRRGSIWSQVNTRRATELSALGLMHPAGLKVFNERDESKTNRYSNENRRRGFDAQYEEVFRQNTRAWEFFQSQPPSYRHPAAWWVMSAKREDTRQRRLATLIRDSEAGRRVAPLTPPARRS